MRTKALAMHSLLALANTNLATWVDNGDTHALLVGVGAAHALVAHTGYADLANHDIGQPYGPAKPAWYRLAALVHLASVGATAVPVGAGIEHLPISHPDASSFAHHLALQVEGLNHLPWLCAVRNSANGQAKPGAPTHTC